MRKFFGIVLFLFVVGPAITLALVSASVAPWLMDRNFYTDILGNEAIYEIILNDQLPLWLNRDVIPQSDQLPNAALALALREVVTPRYLREQAVTIVNGVFDVIEGKSDTFHAALDIRPIKLALNDPDTRQQFSIALVEALPPCTTNQSPIAPGGTVYQCLPAGASPSQAAEAVSGQIMSWLETAPDSLDVTDIAVGTGGASSFSQQDWREFTQVFGGASTGILSTCVTVLALPVVFVWLIVGLTSSSGRRGRLQWLGWMLLIPAAIILTVGLTANATSIENLVRTLSRDVTTSGFIDNQAFQDVAVQVMGTIFSNMARYFTLVGGIASAAGFGLVLLGLLSPSPDRYGDGRYVVVGAPEKPKREDQGDGGYDDGPIQPL